MVCSDEREEEVDSKGKDNDLDYYSSAPVKHLLYVSQGVKE